MKKTSIFFAIATIALLSACRKENFNATESTPGAVTVIGVGINDVKTTMGAPVEGTRKIYWANGDQLQANDLTSAALADLPEECTSARFTFDGTLTYPANLLYPADYYKDESTITLPLEQPVTPKVALYGYMGEEGDAQMSALLAYVHIPLTQGEDKDEIKAMIVESLTDGYCLSGDFTIDYETGALTPAAEASKKVSVLFNKPLNPEKATDFFAAVPAGENVKLSVKFKDVKGHCMTKTVTRTFAAGKVVSLPDTEFVPTTTEFDVVITTAAQLVQFAKDYNDGKFNNPIVQLGSDIVFDETTSAQFNETGGIGLKVSYYADAEDYYFDGIFDGGNHTISGLAATTPLFKATSSSSTIQHLTIDDSCSYTFTHSSVAELDAGAVVGYLRGALQDVTVEANISLAGGDISKVTALGGIAGRVVVGKLESCCYSGNIVVPDDFTVAAQKTYIGGLVGDITNADGLIKDSDFMGTIDNQGQLTVPSEDNNYKNNPHLLIGGIVGLNTGTVDGCTTYNQKPGITVILNDGSDHPYSGTIVTHSTIAYHYAIAGIAGRNDGTVTDCTNNAVVLNIFSAERGTSGNMNGRYLEVGGIVGYNSSGKTISGCTNNGGIITRANPKLQYVGGIVAWNDGTVSSCENSSTATIGMGTSHTTPYGARMTYVGGVIGHNRSSASVSNIQNNAAINVSRVESTGGVAHRIGGVIGQNDAAIDGTDGSGTISNSGNIAQSNGVGMCTTPTEANEYGYFLGGVVGYSTKAVKNVSNSGNVTYTCTATGVGAQYVHLGGVIGKVLAASTVDVEKCSNTANVTFTASAKYSGNNATRYYYNYLGGIVGYAKNAAIKGDSSTKCTNSGIIKGGDASANNNQGTPSFTIGGIVGYLTGESSIDYCELSGTGQAYNDHWSNRGITNYDCPIDGGIAGLVDGADTAPIPVSNCTVTSTKKDKDTDPDGFSAIFARRGAVGGIVGMAKYATISNCTVPVPFSGSGYFYGGIVAAAQNSTISNCTYSGTTIQSTQIQIGGGIIGQLDTATTIDGCSSYATTVNKNGTAVTTTGGIAGKSVAGSTIANCHYTASIAKICGDSNFTNGGGNVADL